ncbi:hypothetical protein [Bradyrhizobium betae]|uniref:Uncharacterized protein n=1 Tax=Bradyrhizobium betae TaxID=244734 RepID=A0A5P6NYU8_9BRAD|nr:hypothetical protein [Bradyrhizobium betae]MCS3725455.1 hypothetical protein [Bradyrhizobium betae]QFI71251.1 hypothetical protein F8237_01995 [Bradyrhizobium betae]
MGFHRTRQPQPVHRVPASVAVSRFICEQEIGDVLAGQDPFGLDNDCLNPAGHDAIASCGAVVCPHCAKVFWR